LATLLLINQEHSAFTSNANMADAKAITKSIEKTFKWLPNKTAASAHPVPGL
jgi:hypothetical protein